MTQPALADVFPGATQDANSITIPKTALPGLTATVSNNADQICVGLLLAELTFYTQERQNGDADVSIVITRGTPAFQTVTDAQGNQTVYVVDSLTIRPRYLSSLPALDPDNY